MARLRLVSVKCETTWQGSGEEKDEEEMGGWEEGESNGRRKRRGEVEEEKGRKDDREGEERRLEVRREEGAGGIVRLSKHGSRQRICLEPFSTSKKACVIKKQQRAGKVKSVVSKVCILE